MIARAHLRKGLPVWVAGIFLGAVASPALADPPALTAVPPVTFDFPNVTVGQTNLVFSRRGLNLAVADATVPLPSDGLGLVGFGSPNPGTAFPASFTPNTTANSTPGPCFAVLGPNATVAAPAVGECPFQFNVAAGSFSYSLYESQALNVTTVNNGVQATVRIAGGGATLATASGATAGDAAALALAQSNVFGMRGRILRPIVTQSVLTRSVVETTTRRLTGEDFYQYSYTGLGPTVVNVGNRGRCSAAVTNCQGGLQLNVLGDQVVLGLASHLDLYVTTTTQRTITTAGAETIDIPIAAAGIAHPAAQMVGFEMSDYFLRRLIAPGAAGYGAPAGTSAEAAKWSVFFEGMGAFGNYGGSDKIVASRFDMAGGRGGVAYHATPEWTFGAAFEGGHWSWSMPDPQLPENAGGGAFRGALFAAYAEGPWKIFAAAMGGTQRVNTQGWSFEGAGSSSAAYDAAVYGAGAEGSYAVPLGDGFTARPLLGATWLGWSTPAANEVGGVAPLYLQSAARNQFRPTSGAMLEKLLDLGGRVVTLQLTGRAFAVVGDTRGEVGANDWGSITPYSIIGPRAGVFGGEIGAGAGVAIASNVYVAANWSTRFRAATIDNTGRLTLKVGF
jgi:hypothetical protein